MSDEREPLVSPVFDGPVTGSHGWDAEAARSRSAGLPSVTRDNSRFQGPRSRSVSALHIGNDVSFTKRDFRNRRNDSTSATLTARAGLYKPISGALPAAVDEDEEEDTSRLTRLQASINMVKCAIGGGSFSLPFAFKEGGLAFSFVGTLFFGWISAHTVNMLANSERRAWHKFEAQDVLKTPSPQPNEQSKFTYPALGKFVFPNAVVPLPCGLSFNIVEAIIYFGIALTGLGVCAAYVDFITSTLPQVFSALDVTSTTLILAPIFWALSMLRSYRFLAFTSVLGDIAVTAGIISVVVYGATQHSFKFDVPQFEVKSFPKFIGSTSFLFAIHIVILPIMQSMKDKERFKTVTHGSYFFITVINGLFGAMCFMLFGADTEPNVVKNLPTNIFLDIVKVLLCVDLLFSLPMILAATREVVEEPIVLGMKNWVETTRNIIRTTLVGLVFVICFGVPDFGDMVSLVGGFVNSLMGFILPPIIHMKQQYDEDRLTQGSLMANSTIVLFGCGALVVSTYYTIQGIIDGSAS